MPLRGKGIIINLSSIGSLAPSALLNVYAATKIFVNYFSSGLQYEYGDTGIIVQVRVCGMGVAEEGDMCDIWTRTCSV